MALTKITNDLLDLGSDTGALGLPKGTEAQRPSNPVEGTLRHNSEIDETKLETFDGTDWKKINKVESAYAVDYLVVAGGGGGGSTRSTSGAGGGGGAGGYRSNVTGESSGGGAAAESSLTLTGGTSYAITIGSGGAGGPVSLTGTSGNDSVFHTITSIGGGGGGGGTTAPFDPFDGGSGGGGCFSVLGGDGTVNQGFRGGNSIESRAGAGGGGASSQGIDIAQSGYPYPVNGTAGGFGVSSAITGTSIARAGGGGGGADNTSGGGTAVAGGGAGGNNSIGVAGTANTGGGGGGGGSYSTANAPQNAGAGGGSGVVILRIPTANYSGATTGTPTVTTDGTDTILTYTSSGTYTA